MNSDPRGDPGDYWLYLLPGGVRLYAINADYEPAKIAITVNFGFADRLISKGAQLRNLAVALAAIEDASLKDCGGFTIHRGKGGWIDPAGKTIKEEVAILMVSGSYASIEAIAAIGKRMLGRTAIYVKKPDGSTILL